MNYITFSYSIILLFSTYYSYKKKLGSSKNSSIISSLLFFSTFLNLFYLNIFLKTFISILLIMISLGYFYDRRVSKKELHYTHHFARLIVHVFIIYFLYH